jgi:hypothetical protein
MNGKDCEGSDDDMIHGTSPASDWMDWGKPRTVQLRPLGEIWTRNLSNNKKLQPFEHSLRLFSELFSVWKVSLRDIPYSLSNRPWRPIGSWDVEAPTYCGEVVPLLAGLPLLPGRFLVLISVRDWINPRTRVRLEGLGELKNPMT